jgi:hypothetical protein
LPKDRKGNNDKNKVFFLMLINKRLVWKINCLLQADKIVVDNKDIILFIKWINKMALLPAFYNYVLYSNWL